MIDFLRQTFISLKRSNRRYELLPKEQLKRVLNGQENEEPVFSFLPEKETKTNPSSLCGCVPHKNPPCEDNEINDYH